MRVDVLTRIANLTRRVVDYRTFGILLYNEPTRELVSKAQEKAVVVTFDHDIAEVPVERLATWLARLDDEED